MAYSHTPEIKHKFKKGDIIILIANPSMNAPVGSRAKVIERSSSGRIVEVEWIGNISQMNGGYYTKNFVLYNNGWDA